MGTTLLFDEGGRYIGNDGKNDHKTYVIKTTQQEFDSEVNSAGISRKEAKNTKKFIKDNSGNSMHYVFAMSEKVVYIYDNKGVIATIPFKSFVK